MIGKRERVVRLLDRVGIFKVLTGARNVLPPPWITVLTYHRVSKVEDETRFDTGVIDATPEQFERQVSYLAENFDIIGISDLLAYYAGGALPKKPVLITFDDGYRDCLTVAAPILERYGAKAAFFIATDYAEKRRLYWWDRIAYALRHTKKIQLELSYPKKITVDLDLGLNKEKNRLFKIVKTEEGLDLERFIEELFMACEVEWTASLERVLANEAIMTWDEIVELENRGMEVHSHTRTHRVLGTLTATDLDGELSGSRNDLAKKIEGSVEAIAYPVGYSVAESKEIREAIDKAGYQIGFTNQSGVNLTMGTTDPLDVRRVAMDIDMSDEMFRGIMALPYLSRTR